MVLGNSAGLSDSDWDRLEERIAFFEASWKRGERPKIVDFLGDQELHGLALLIELVHTELEFRLKDGESARVEEYLRNYPSLEHSRATVLDLIRAEWSLRKRREPDLSMGSFIDRFPEFRDDLDVPKSDPPATTTAPPPSSVLGLKSLEPTDQPLPRRFGKYQLRQKLGNGTFGVVYRAWDLVLNREVAIKIPRPEAIAAHQNVRAFLREARNAIDLRHPHIVAIHDAGPIEGIVCIVRSYVEGTTLADQIRDAPLAPEESAAVMTLVADALEYAHSKGIIHRDLKPSNILIDHNGQPHVSDFGLAKRESVDSTLSTWSKHGGMIGTPAYMSPEQARGDPQGVDPRSDVFSAGIVLYELLTGSLPFRGRGRLLLVQIQELEPTWPRLLNDEVTEDLESICLKAIAKNPAERYQTASEMADDLRTFLSGRPIPPRPAPRQRTPERRRKFRSIPLAIPIGLIGLLLVSTTLWLRTEQREKRQAGLTERIYRSFLEVARLAEKPGRSDSDRRQPMADQLWSEAEKLAPALENDPTLLPLAAEAQRKFAERALASGSDCSAVGHWEKVVALNERLTSLKPSSLEHRENLAIGLLNLAQIRDRFGEKSVSRQYLERAQVLLRENLDACRRDLKIESPDPEPRLKTVQTLLLLAEIDERLGRPADLSEVETLLQGIDQTRAIEPLILARMANLELELAGLELSSSLIHGSIGSADRAQRWFDKLPDGPIVSSGIARACLIRGRAYGARKYLPEARKYYRLAIARLESIVEANPDPPESRRWLGVALFEYGRLLDQSGSQTDAVANYRKALEIRRTLVRETPDGYLNLLELAETRSALAVEPGISPIQSAWLDLLTIGDRLQVLALDPGLTENRRELRRLSETCLKRIRIPGQRIRQ